MGLAQGCDSWTQQASEIQAPGEQNNEWDSGGLNDDFYMA